MELKKKIWQDSMLRYYPKGYTDPDFLMLRLKPKLMKAWYHSTKYEATLSD